MAVVLVYFMTEDLIAAFLQKTNGDISLQEKIQEASDISAVVDIAKEAGFDITVDEFAKVKSEILDRELESAAGGWGFQPTTWNYRGHNVTHIGKLLDQL